MPLPHRPSARFRSTSPGRPALRAAVLLALAALGWLAYVPVQRYLGVAQPPQFYRAVDRAGVHERDVVAVAHNAGDHAGTMRRAVRHGADVIEVDVISARGSLVAGRRQRPLPWLSELLFRGPSLGRMWQEIPQRVDVLLDLKETDRALLDQLTSFLRARAGGHDVLISSRNAVSLRYLRPRVTHATLLLTMAWPADVTRLRLAPDLTRFVDGVSVYEGLLDADLVAQLHARSLEVITWPVNDVPRLRALVAAGVDGVTTDNLGIVEALGAS